MKVKPGDKIKFLSTFDHFLKMTVEDIYKVDNFIVIKPKSENARILIDEIEFDSIVKKGD